MHIKGTIIQRDHEAERRAKLQRIVIEQMMLDDPALALFKAHQPRELPPVLKWDWPLADAARRLREIEMLEYAFLVGGD